MSVERDRLIYLQKDKNNNVYLENPPPFILMLFHMDAPELAHHVGGLHNRVDV